MNTSQSLTAAAILLAHGLFIACAPPDEAPRAHWTDVTDSTEVRIVRESESPCEDCITLERVLVMGDTVGEGYLRGAFHLVRDSAGNYWFGQYEAVKVFDAAGSFLGEVGRAGEGPLEWGDAMPVHTDLEGRVHIFDGGNYRHSVVGPDFTLIEDHPLPDHVADAGPLGDGRQWVVNMWHPTPDAIGSPLHVVERGEIKRSFGGFVDPENPRAQTASWRAFTTDSAHRIFSSPLYGAYSIEVWAEDGRRVTGFLVPGFNDPPRDPDAPESADNPPASTIRALRVDSEDRLWVLTWRRRDDWLDMMEERPGPGGRVRLEMKPEYQAIDRHYGQSDVIDLTTATVIARTRTEGVVLVDFLGEDELWSGEFFGPGHLRAGIWEIGFTP
ncbi:MAG: hypothetical protein F4179_13100 [Gammaproteobacteria bacterium]|nr:hypothetical protein [Gammaproteobacteria bacterium]